MRCAFAIAVLLAGFALGADEPPPPPKSAPALAAIHKAESAQKVAQETYDAAMFKAKKTEIEELRIAVKTATRNGDLDEANAIAAQIKSIEADMGDAAPLPPAAANMLGAWKTQYQGRDIRWAITLNGVTHDEAGDQTGVPEVQGHLMVIKWPSGMVDRLTFVDNRFFVETWTPGKPTSGPPQNVAVGVRDTSGK